MCQLLKRENQYNTIYHIVKICHRNLLSSIDDWPCVLGVISLIFVFCYFYFISMNYTAFVVLPDLTYKNEQQAPWESDRASINRARPGWPVRQYLHKPGTVNASPCQSPAVAHGTGGRWLSVDADGLMAALKHTFPKLICISFQRNQNGVSLLVGDTMQQFLIGNEMECVAVSCKRKYGRDSSL